MNQVYHHNSDRGQAGLLLLMVFLLAAIVSIPTTATAICRSVCDSDLEWEDHSLQPGMDTTNLPAPIPDFCVCSDSACVNEDVRFVDYSQGVIRTWSWDFGDPGSGVNNYSSLESPSHSYSSPGVYTVTLTVVGYGAPVTIVKEHVIIVRTGPTADWIVTPDSGCVATLFRFEDRSINANSWLWYFGDGATSTEQNPTHSYAAPGTYTVWLMARNDCDWNKKYGSVTVTVDGGPIAVFDYEMGPQCEGSSVSFFDRSTNAVNWLWNFGDGSTATDQNPIHTYARAGSYAVSLTVTNECGADDTTEVITVSLVGPPVADFTSTLDGDCIGATATFDNLSSDAVTYLWNFGDGASSTEVNPSHTYNTAGSFTVILTATNECGSDVETKVQYINITDRPKADFEASGQLHCLALPVRFFDLSTDAQTWFWDFGDGATSPDQNPVHTYATPGTYTVTLQVTNDCGEDTKIKEQYITIIERPLADFTSDLTDLCLGGVVEFTDLSIGSSSWNWSFGDGTYSTDQNPIHEYLTPGVYTVTLSIDSECGEDLATKTEYITVRPGPIADFRAVNTQACADGPVTFLDMSIDAATWHWDFGDGNTSTDQNPVHTYAVPGIYSVTLAVTNDCGEDTEIKEQYVRLRSGPVADFRASIQEYCVGGPIDFVDLSTDADSWFWEFGDGTTSTDRNPSHAYQTDGLFTVSLTVTNECGTDTETRPSFILIHPDPAAEFTADQTELCVGEQVSFTDQSNEARRWDWDFGDGNSSQDQNPTHRYNIAGTYDVSLTISSGCGDDTETKTAYVVVHPAPIANYYWDKHDVCIEEEIQFTDNSQYATAWTWHFGDGQISHDQNPVHTYADTGAYLVWLDVTNECGSDGADDYDYVRVHGAPKAQFTTSDPWICEDGNIGFTNLSENATSWLWDFGDGTTSTDETPQPHTYSPGTYSVQMRAYNDCGDDLATLSYDIVVSPNPVADFSVGDPLTCVGRPVSFFDHSTDADTWLWTFGDGTTSAVQNPTHVYASAGTYTVSLAVSNDCGDDRIEFPSIITVESAPTADFTASNPQACVEIAVQFTSLSSDAMRHRWDFGDGHDSYDENPFHSYSAAGTYTVSLWVANDCGDDTETKTAYITVGERPTVGFTSNNSSVCVGGTIDFTDQSIGATSWSWSFGDGETSTAQSPSHTYTQPGMFVVHLSATNSCGTDYSSLPYYITVDPKPTADFSYVRTSPIFGNCGPNTFQFTDESDDAESWLWDLGDGTTSTDQDPRHTYSVAGSYDVTLTATNACGSDVRRREIQVVIDDAPVAAFTANTTDICAGGTVQFTDQSSAGYSWRWDFGDSTQSSDQHPSHVYANPGIYTVTLHILSFCGTDTETKTAYITVESGPWAGFTGQTNNICVGGAVNFTDQSTGADSWNWNFGDGTTSSIQNPSHTFTQSGIYSVFLTVTNSCGSDFTIFPFRVFVSPAPTADFTYQKTGECGPETVSFTNLSDVGDSWHWDFGDGTTSTLENPNHGYAVAGNYDVTLTVTNDCGTDDITKQIPIVIVPPPVAGFTSSTTETCVGSDVDFTDQSTGALSWNWDFGDGTGSNDQNPSHSYTTAGTFTVTLEIVGACGTDYVSKENHITVDPEPMADFIAPENTGCAGRTQIPFTDMSVGAESWLWEFGDGHTATTQNPINIYTNPGVYTVTLTVTNECGSDSEVKPQLITIYGDPVADFSYQQESGCDTGTVFFTDLSTDAGSYHWDFGDGNDSWEQHPTHRYSSPGDYTVSLTVFNWCEGEDTQSRIITVAFEPGPTADFAVEVDEVCEGDSVWFIDQSTLATIWLWDFGDGNGSSDQYPTHVYNIPGAYTVSLTVTNDCGDDTETKVNFVTVLAGPDADFSASPTNGSPTLAVTFTDLSLSTQGISAWTWDFGDGGSSSQPNPTHDYTAPGTYTVSLIVEDACGVDTVAKDEYIYVTDSCSVGLWTEVTDGCAPLTAWFGGYTEGDCDITSWLWDFGDPASGSDNADTAQETQHIYADPGTYTVTLTAVNGTDTMVVTKTNLVTAFGGPTASFRASPASGIAPLWSNFTNLSTSPNGSMTYSWDFGDPASGSANSSSDRNPGHTYATVGTYVVTLVATDMCGSDTTTETVTVAEALEIVKAVDKPFATAGEEVLYTLTLRNNGPEPFGLTQVIDTIPDMAFCMESSITGPGVYAPRGDFIVWSVFSLAPGAEETFTFKVLLDGPFPQFPAVVSNYAVASTGVEGFAKLTPQVFYSNIVETIVDIPTGAPSIDKAVNVALASPGDTLTYTITVSNSQPSAASGLKVYDAPPEYTSFLGNITGGGTYDPLSDSIFWDLGTLAMFSDTTVSFEVTVNPDAQSGQEIPNSATFVTNFLGGGQSDTVITLIHLEPIVITKTANRPSAMIGDLVRFTIKVQNFSGEIFNDLMVLDTMPVGITYISGTSVLDGAGIADPTGANPVTWALGDLPPNSTATLEYTSLVSPSAHPGLHDNIARAEATQNGIPTQSNRALARIYVMSYTISGAIRGRVIIDCDGDGIADMTDLPKGIDIYLDDGSQSRVNDTGMFYFSTVRPGERVVALDERDLKDFFVPEGAQASVFVHVHESGESYVLFRICPDYPKLDILKKASIIPTVKVHKRATINPEPVDDSLGVLIDYQIDITSNGFAEPTQVRLVDSFPENMNVILSESTTLVPKQSDNQLVYEITAAEARLQESVYYSLKDMAPGVRRYLTNKVHLEGDPGVNSQSAALLVSDPAEVAAGPFLIAPPRDVKITLTPALFITSKAFLQPPAFPLLRVVADSIRKYSDAKIAVEGHTDLRLINTVEFPSNWELGEARAKAVADWLIDSAGISGDRMSYESFAATRPVVTDVPLTSAALQPNRRTEVIIKAGVQGFLAPDAGSTDSWESSTSLALSPNRFDTLFEALDKPVAIDLDDSWEIVLTVVNESEIGAEIASLTDVLPSGTQYLPGTATLDGVSISASVDGARIRLKLEQIKPSQRLELRYRIRAVDGQQPSGGGAATIEVKTASDHPVVQSSNTVTFK